VKKKGCQKAYVTVEGAECGLQKKYKNRKIILIWDGASYHKYGEFRDFLLELNGEKEPDDWSITCILFAPNAPQQNPVEDIWLKAKNFLGSSLLTMLNK
jgi:transposase